MAMDDPEGKLIDSVAKIDDFFRRVLHDDLGDWALAKDFGEFLVRLDPEEALGHAFLARAYRHLGQSARAFEELEACRLRVAYASEKEVLGPFLAEERRHLTGGG